MAKPLPLNPHLVPGIKLKNDPIEFDGDCIDPYAKFVIAEALDYAIENSLSRLKRAGQVITDVETHGFPALEIVQGIRDALEKAPGCPRDLTSQEQDMIATYLAREGIKKPGPAPKTEKKPVFKAESLTAEVWNTLPIVARAELAKTAGLEGKGPLAAGSFKKPEWQSLVKAYSAAVALATEPPKKVVPPKPEVVEPPIETILVVKLQDPTTRETKQIGFDVLDRKTGLIARRITMEEGAKLLGEGKARIG